MHRKQQKPHNSQPWQRLGLGLAAGAMLLAAGCVAVPADTVVYEDAGDYRRSDPGVVIIDRGPVYHGPAYRGPAYRGPVYVAPPRRVLPPPRYRDPGHRPGRARFEGRRPDTSDRGGNRGNNRGDFRGERPTGRAQAPVIPNKIERRSNPGAPPRSAPSQPPTPRVTPRRDFYQEGESG